jgi:hypothetical protein
MTQPVRVVAEEIARQTSRRGLLSRGASLLFGTLAGVAAGAAARGSDVLAGDETACAFPGPPCNCEHCQPNGLCGKPCIILTSFYASGCWVARRNGATCCDCTCEANTPNDYNCGCGTDYHNNPKYCPN